MVHPFGIPDSHSTPGLDFQADSLTIPEAAGILETIRSCRRCGTPGPWGISRGEVFRELSIRAQSGRVAALPFGQHQSVPESQQEANARFITEVGNHAEWLLQAVRFALDHGFKP